MYGKRTCRNCGASYEAKKNWQFCCSKECYWDFIKKQSKIKREKDKISFPDFKCPKCGEVTTLTFNPVSNIKEWKKFKCGCGYTRDGDITC